MMSVRHALPDELASVSGLAVEVYRADDLLGVETGYADALSNAAARAVEAELLVAVDAGGQLLGTVTYCRHGSPWAEICRPDEGEFRMLAVAATARGQGVGRALVDACAERASSSGRRSLVLSTLRENASAQAMYARMGFTRVPERDWSPVAGVDLLVWSAALVSSAGTGAGDARGSRIRPRDPGGAARR